MFQPETFLPFAVDVPPQLVLWFSFFFACEPCVFACHDDALLSPPDGYACRVSFSQRKLRVRYLINS